MILEGRTGANRVVEARTDFGTSTPPTWAALQGGMSGGVRRISPTQAVTIPTIVGALQIVAGTAAQLPFQIFRDLGEKKAPIYDQWQYSILETYPGPDTDPFQLKFDIFWSLENYGNAFVLKIKDPKTGIPTELIVLDPERVKIRNENGQKRFDIKVSHNMEFRGATSYEILHIKNLPQAGSMFTGTCGIKLMAARLGNDATASEWEGRFFANDATPPIVITLGDDAGPDEMKEAYDSWQTAHAGPWNAGKPAILGAGAKIEKIGFNLHDAQLIDLHTYNVMDFARGMNMPLSLFIPPHTKPASAEDEGLLYATFYLGPRLRRVESAFNSDPDFFAFNPMWCRVDERTMMRANTQAMALANHAYVQDGVLVPDEVRAELGYDPLPPLMTPEEAANNPGKIPQLTPVGGAPNDNLSKDMELSKEMGSVKSSD